MMDHNLSMMSFGQNILGPIFYDFCRKLHIYLIALNDNSACLFAYRGGMRLLYLYELYLEKNSLSSPMPLHPFLISRILALKGTIKQSYKEAELLLLREYKNIELENFISCVCSELEVNIPQELSQKKIDANLLRQLFTGDSEWMKTVQHYFINQEKLLKKYLFSTIDGKKNIILVDTGWSGTTQLFLMQGFKELNWQGLYFGKWDTWQQNPKHFHTITGIGVEGQTYIRERPETAIFLYHHIIEGPLEPKVPSVEQLMQNSTKGICSQSFVDKNKIPPQSDEPHFMGICNYFINAKNKTISEVSKEVYSARKKLRNQIIFPSSKDIIAMTVEARSADFGKKHAVPIFHTTAQYHVISVVSRFRAVKKSIWKQGKIVQEFPIIYPFLLLLYNNKALLYRILPMQFLNKLMKRINQI